MALPDAAALAARWLREAGENDSAVLELAQALAVGSRRHASLGRVMELAVRHTFVTAPLLAHQLGLTHQGVLLLPNKLVAEGLLREATGRRSFRAFVAT